MIAYNCHILQCFWHNCFVGHTDLANGIKQPSKRDESNKLNCGLITVVESLNPTKTIIGCYSPEYGVIYITMPKLLHFPPDPNVVVKRLQMALKIATSNIDPILIYDGDRQYLNYKQALTGRTYKSREHRQIPWN